MYEIMGKSVLKRSGSMKFLQWHPVIRSLRIHVVSPVVLTMFHWQPQSPRGEDCLRLHWMAETRGQKSQSLSLSLEMPPSLLASYTQLIPSPLSLALTHTHTHTETHYTPIIVPVCCSLTDWYALMSDLTHFVIEQDLIRFNVFPFFSFSEIVLKWNKVSATGLWRVYYRAFIVLKLRSSF